MDIKDLSNYGGFVIGIIGILLSLYLYQKGLEKKEPRGFYRTYREIEKLSPVKDSNIQILYKSKDVDRVFTTYLWLWNKGRKAINQSDVPPQSSITIKLVDKEHDPHILDYRILKTSRNEINFGIPTVDDNKFIIKFDFLDYNDGAVIEIQHTGSYETEVQTEGIILGVPNGIAVTSKQSSSSFFDVYRKMFQRLSGERIVRPTKLYVHKTSRQKFMSFVGYFIVFVLMAGFLFGMNYLLNASDNSRVSVKRDDLKKILVSELPQATDQNFQNIVEQAAKDPNLDKFNTYFILAYAILFAFMYGSVLWSEFSSPVPKSLYFRDEEEGIKK